jgi:hypothetical protein
MTESVAVTIADALADEDGVVKAEAVNLGGGWGVEVETVAGEWTEEQFRRFAIVFGAQFVSLDGKDFLL